MRVWVLASLLLGCGSGGSTATVEEVETGSGDAAVEDTTSPSEAGGDVSVEVALDTASPAVDSAADAPSDASKPCTDAGAKVSQGHCYFPTSPGSWNDAKKACEKVGAHLVTITSEIEQLFVASFGGITERWIGFERKMGDPVFKESYKWITAEPNVIDKWSLTEPNNSGTCGEMTASGLWADADCASFFPGLCERE